MYQCTGNTSIIEDAIEQVGRENILRSNGQPLHQIQRRENTHAGYKGLASSALLQF